LRRPGAGEVALFRHESIPVGVNTGAIFQSRLVENRIPLGAGDLVMLYTDGVTDAANSQDQEFEPTFHKLVLQHGDRPLKELHQVIMDTLRLHTQKPKQDDDITLISVRVQR
jgi:sigma-B regulation protein RsbU (phosphoserine phosphatase)